MSETLPEPLTGNAAIHRWVKPAVFALVIAAFAVISTQYGDQLSLTTLARQEAALRLMLDQRPVLIYGGAFLLYALVTGFSLPGAAVLTLAYGWFFKFWPALILVSFASTTGATLAFLLSRFLFRDAIQRRFGDRLAKFNEALAREGAFYLFTLRLIPLVPFFVINAVMGLTPIRITTFYWVSQLGMLAGTAVYVYAGASVGTLEELSQRGAGGILNVQTIIAFVLLGVFPLIVKWIMAAMRQSSPR